MVREHLVGYARSIVTHVDDRRATFLGQCDVDLAVADAEYFDGVPGSRCPAPAGDGCRSPVTLRRARARDQTRQRFFLRVQGIGLEDIVDHIREPEILRRPGVRRLSRA